MIHDADAPDLRALPRDAWEGVDLLQVRAKRLAAGALERLVRAWVDRLAGLPTRIVVNDRFDVALGAGAHGVHLGRDDLPVEAARRTAPPGFVIGGSARTRRELLEAQAAGADYAGLGAFFPSATKPDAPPLEPSAAGVADPVPDLSIPVLAIGGIDAERLPGVLGLPVVTGVAASAAIQRAADPARAIRSLRRALDEAWAARPVPRMGRAGLLALAVILLARCGGGGPEEGTPEEGTLPADRPLVSREAVALVERFRLDDPARLGNPRDLAVDGEGSLYVLDFSPPRTRLLKYDSTGQYVLAFGEEADRVRLVSAIELSLAPWNTVYVVDRGPDAIVTFLTRGTFTSSAEVDPGIALDVHPLPAFGEFLLHKWVPEQSRSVVLHARTPLDSIAIAYEVQVPPGQSVRREARDVHYHTATDRLGRLYVAFYDGYPVRVLTPGGETLRTIELDRQPIAKPAAVIDAERETNLARLREQAPDLDEAVVREAAEPDSVRPLIEEVVVDPFDRMWVRTNRADAAGATPYDVFNEQGQYLARVDVPGIVQRTAFRPDGTMFVIAAPEPGGAGEVVGYAVRLGGAVPEEDAARAPD